MKLEKMVVNGFKSFADRTEFEFNQQITAIVGPNGCGKSNVVDAVKWVLGEQSPRSLRSGNMADLIFSGSSSRRPGGMAEVILSFSGVAGALGTDQDELQIGRRLYRSGDSEYLMNGKVCRLRDIREMFMDTGVGMKAYSIIEQGQIDQLLHASKIDRRVIFEEAAGISRYKAHKTEALRKLEKTEQNLLRLADIVAEVQRQLRSVKLQAGKARNFLEYSERLKQLRLKYSLSEYHRMYTQLAERKAALAGLEEQFAAAAAAVGRHGTSVSELSTEMADVEGLIRAADNALVSTGAKIEQNLEKIRFLQSRAEELSQRRDAAGRQAVKLAEQSQLLKQEMSAAQDELARCHAEHQARDSEVGRLEQTIRQLSADCAAIETRMEEQKGGIIDIVRKTARLHNEIQSLCAFRDNLAGQKERLTARADSGRSQLERLLSDTAADEARLGDIEKVIADLQKNLDERREEMTGVNREMTADAESLAKKREERSGLQRELAVLGDMENRQEGLKAAVKKLLEARQKGGDQYRYIEAIVADAIRAEAEYAQAAEAALEGKADAVIVTDTSTLLQDSEKLVKMEGRVNMLAMDGGAAPAGDIDLSKITGARGRLKDFVRVDGRYDAVLDRFLARTVVVDTLAQALDGHKITGGRYSFVTMDGQVVSADGLITVGTIGCAGGLISRKSRLEELQKQLDRLNAEIDAAQERMNRHDQQNRHLAALCQDLRTSIYESNTAKADLLSRIKVSQQEIRRLEQEQPAIKAEMEALEQQIVESIAREQESKKALAELEKANAECTTCITELEEQAAEKRTAQTAEAAKLTDLRVAMGQITEKMKGLTSAIAGLSSQMQQAQASLESSRAEVATCSQQVEQTQAAILSCETAVADLFAEKERLQNECRTRREKLEDIAGRRTREEEAMKKAAAEQSSLESQIHQVKLELSQIEVRLADLIDRVRDELSVDIAEAYREYREEETDWEAVRAEIAELRGKIDRLGSVNVEAIQEQEELEKRNEFLTTQVEDLQKSKSQLEQLIAKINRESREKFRQTFDLVRVNFQEIFRKLFGGGRADIVLDDPEDLLESGIEIIARPPGKETRSISLLSGGEKTMTAIALLFAVFKIKPSPFCFLDEVDAALDEANVERFNMIVKEFKEDSQFIVITHSKRTMSIADAIYGVTMQTQGVSKKISIRFEDYDSREPAAVA